MRVVPRRGTYVAQLAPDEVGDLMEVREALEGVAAWRAALRLSDGELEAMHQHLAAIQSQAETCGLGEYPQEGKDFHEWIVEGSGNPRLKALLRAIQGQVRLIRFQSGATPTRAGQTLREPPEILEAIRRRDPDLAEGRMRAHIRAARENILRLWSSEPGP